MSKHGTNTARVAESGKISCDQGEQRGEQLLNRRGFFEKGFYSSYTPDRPLGDFRRISCRLVHHSNLSRNGVSGKPGAIQ